MQSVIRLLLISCFLFSTAFAQQKKLSLLPPSATGINFRNDIEEDVNMFYYLYEYLYLGGGVAAGDINNDGLTDLYFSSTRGSNKLYLNLGNFNFRDITAAAGVDGGGGIKTGVNMFDVNNDGWLDIIVCKSGYKDPQLRKKMVYINNGNGTFTNKAAELGLDDASYSVQAYYIDYDNDGDKDIYFLNHPIDFNKAMNIPVTMVNGKLVYSEDTNTVYVSDRLYENRNGKFYDVTKKAGLINHAFGLSVSVFDFNNDGWPDIYVANDFNKPDFIYINNKNGTFTDHMKEYLSHNSFSSMGTDVADINNDGLEDIFVVDMAVEEPVRQKQLFSINQNYDKFNLMLQYNLFYQYPRNCLQLNNGNGTFSEIANYAHVAETEWSWAPLIADFDNDGWKDIYITNGLKKDVSDWDYKVFVLDSISNVMNRGKSVDLDAWLRSIPQVKTKNYFYHNNRSLQFTNYADIWTDAPPSFSNGAAYADLDNDGDLDLVVNNVDDVAFVFKNNSRETEGGHYLRFKLLKSKNNAQEADNTIVKLTDADGKIQVQHYNTQRGFMSTMEHVLHFGTGAQAIIPKAEIIFPSQKKMVLENIPADQVLTVYETDATQMQTALIRKQPVFTDVTAQNKFKYLQTENDYIDFKREPLIPYKCSRKGPYYAMADVNGDGKADMYIGGAAGTPGTLMIQGAAGQFTEKKAAAFTADKMYEDMDAVFFDADGDKDNDLYVVSGGAQFEAGSNLYQDRLYINDGKGNFTRAPKALPAETFNGSCVTILDYDADGDPDLFIGGHVLPGKFPQADKCMLLQNNNGIFNDVTASAGTALLNAGIINSASWADADGDGKKELIIAGEWMPVTIYYIDNGSFKKQQAATVSFQSPVTKEDTVISLNEFTGWWYCSKVADVDNDGDLDIIAGNRGTNASIKGDYYNPCTVYAKDFDGNGSYDAVLGYYIQGKCYPLYSRDQLIDQMPSMRKKFIRYKDYSGTILDDLFTPQQKTGMDIYKTRFFESGVLVNEGHNHFRFIPFPEKAQLSNINDFITGDFDKDGQTDILACGNSNDAAVMVGNYDAMPVLLLKGNSKGNFTEIPQWEAGFKVKGECRKLVYNKESSSFIILKNSAPAQVFQLN
jgi:hypothetical protein